MTADCLNITIVYDTDIPPGFPLNRERLRELLSIILNAMGMADAVFSLRLVDDAEIAKLNATFLGCSGPTNVLSFPSDPEEGGDGSLGEIALSIPTLVRETDLYGQYPDEHTARLVSHAILHIAGYDHGPEMDMLTDVAVEAVVGAWADPVQSLD